jgi:hypothetical protein
VSSLTLNMRTKLELGGNMSFHDLHLHTIGDATAWKASGIGPSKRFKKEELDKKYVQLRSSLGSRVP